ncbi:MAG: hypothetical protein ACRETQ_12715, partial [Gammaproteobacteria bacterium]
GHRPCAYCRRPRYREFKRAWCAANMALLEMADPRASWIDAELHQERVTRRRAKVIYTALFSDLPPGTFIVLNAMPYLLWQGRLFPWAHFGYRPSRPMLTASAQVGVLTPRSIVAMFAEGFTPEVHASAGD